MVKQYLLGSLHSVTHLSHLAWRSQKDDRYVTSLVLSRCSNTLLKLRINYLEKPINKSIKCLPSTEPKDVILIKGIFKWTKSIYDIRWCCSFVPFYPLPLPRQHFKQSTPTAAWETRTKRLQAVVRTSEPVAAGGNWGQKSYPVRSLTWWWWIWTWVRCMAKLGGLTSSTERRKPESASDQP